MRLHALYIEGFGRFSKPHTFEFDPDGITVVYGDNEMGKSTIKDAICAVIFGFESVREKEKYYPWDASSVYAASVVLSSDTNLYRIHRDFDTDTVTVTALYSNSENQVFQGVVTPRGRGYDYTVYSEFLTEVIGFSTPDIFRLTTLVEQMNTKTEISQEIRQLISGAEEDYTAVEGEMESELQDLTRNYPGSTLRKKRKIEEIEERIDEIAQKLSNTRDLMQRVGMYQSEIETLETEVRELNSKYRAREKNFEDLKNYIEVREDLRNSQEDLHFLEEGLETFRDFAETGNIQPRSQSSLIGIALVVVAVAFSLTLFVLTKDIILTVIPLVTGIILEIILHFLSKGDKLSSEISELKKASIRSEKKEEIETKVDELRRKVLDLNSLEKALTSEYPSFVQADQNNLVGLQERITRERKELADQIQEKTERLQKLQFDVERYQQDVQEFTQLEEEEFTLQEQLAHLCRRRDALILALSVLRECIFEYQEKYVGYLEEILSRSFSKITNNVYTKCTLERPSLEPVLSSVQKNTIKKENLSVGAQEQLYFAMRLSMAYLLSRNIQLPFLLDDPFVNYDEKRLENVQFILSNVKKTNQIILFVHDPHYKVWSNTVIDLNEGVYPL